MTEVRTSKYCPGCEQEKPMAEFYQNEGCYRDGLSSHCKLCMRANSKKYSSSRHTRKEPKSTRRARAILAAAGIPCTTGKAAGYTWADLAAWGCIPIEAKGCTITYRNGNQRVLWAFTHKQQSEGFEDGFFVLLAWFKDDRLPMRSFIIPTSEEWVTHHTWSRRYGREKESEPKKGLGMRIAPKRGAGGLGAGLWWKLVEFEDRFDLIEQRRLEIAALLAAKGVDE